MVPSVKPTGYSRCYEAVVPLLLWKLSAVFPHILPAAVLYFPIYYLSKIDSSFVNGLIQAIFCVNPTSDKQCTFFRQLRKKDEVINQCKDREG